MRTKSSYHMTANYYMLLGEVKCCCVICASWCSTLFVLSDAGHVVRGWIPAWV